MARKVALTVNGKRHTVQSAPDTMLLYVLRNELGLQGPRFGCGLSQCGYCINGMVMQSVVFLQRNPRPTEAQIKKALNANICRCGTHYRIVKAVARAARTAA